MNNSESIPLVSLFRGNAAAASNCPEKTIAEKNVQAAARFSNVDTSVKFDEKIKESGPQKPDYLFTCPPLGFFKHVAGHRNHKEGAKAYLQAKMTGRVVFRKSEVPGWKEAARLGLVFENSKNNREIFLRSYKTFSGPRARLSAAIIKTDIVAAIHAVLIQYNLIVQQNDARDDREGRKATTCRKQRELRSSAHNGGVALSIMAGQTGKSKSTCSRMRKLIEKAGFGEFKRRSVLISHAAGDERQRVRPDDFSGSGHLWVTGDGILMKEVTAEACVSFFSISFKKIYKKPGSKKPAKARSIEYPTFYNH